MNVRKNLVRWLVGCISYFAATLPRDDVHAEPRIALVIGNGAYAPTLGQLNNPANDAKAVAVALQKAGFDVDARTDLDQVGMKRAVERVAQRLRAAGNKCRTLRMRSIS